MYYKKEWWRSEAPEAWVCLGWPLPDPEGFCWPHPKAWETYYKGDYHLYISIEQFLSMQWVSYGLGGTPEGVLDPTVG